MVVLNTVYPLIRGFACNFCPFVQCFQGFGINGYNGGGEYIANKITHEQDNKKNRPHTKENNDHYNIYPIYPLIIYVIDIVMFFGINLWRNKRIDLNNRGRLR